MSGRETGDLAFVRRGGGDSLARWSTQYGGEWWFLDSGTWTDGNVPGRSVAVIDPENREQVERLLSLYDGKRTSDALPVMQAALREFADPTPPKPEEPTGLGAVVEDAEGVLWIRWQRGHRAERNWKSDVDSGDYREFKDIAAVKVLSEGVRP